MEDKNEKIYLHMHRVMMVLNETYPVSKLPMSIAYLLEIKMKKTPDFIERILEANEIREYCEYFCKEGLAERTNKKNDKEIYEYKLTVKGVIFINRGGFKWKYQNDKLDFMQSYKERKIELDKNRVARIIPLLAWVVSIGQLIVFVVISISKN